MVKDNSQSIRAVLQIQRTGSDTKWKELWKWLLAPSTVKTSQADVPESCEPKGKVGEDAH